VTAANRGGRACFHHGVECASHRERLALLELEDAASHRWQRLLVEEFLSFPVQAPCQGAPLNVRRFGSIPVTLRAARGLCVRVGDGLDRCGGGVRRPGHALGGRCAGAAVARGRLVGCDGARRGYHRRVAPLVSRAAAARRQSA